MRFVTIICLMVIILFRPFVSESHTILSPDELYRQAYEFAINKDYTTAVLTLQQILEQEPETTNEEVYWKLAEIYDQNLYDYAEALFIYQTYLERFPRGRYAAGFEERRKYLTENHEHWDLLKSYKYICDTYYTRSIKENINLMEELLRKFPTSLLTPEIYNWLASNYFQLKQNKQALDYAWKYLTVFPAEKPEYELQTAYKQYISILTALHRYREALTAVDTHLKTKITDIEYTEIVTNIKKENRIRIGFLVSMAYLLSVVVLVIFQRPWRNSKSIFRWTTLLWFGIIAVLTLVPMAIVQITGYGYYPVFPSLTLAGSIILILLKLLSPLADRHLVIYFFLTFFLILTGIYLPFYAWDSLHVFWSPVEWGG